MKYNPYTHIIGKVYDLTQENMNALLYEIDKLNLKLKELHSDSLEDHQEYKRTTTQLIKDLREENARYREALQSIHDDMSRTVNMKMNHVQEGVEDKAISTIVKATTINKLREALKGE
jgi:ABC-type phosphate transport system auxiliary subunit